MPHSLPCTPTLVPGRVPRPWEVEAMAAQTVSAGLVLATLATLGGCVGPAQAQPKIRVLSVGGDWKSQLPNYRGTTPLRGHFVHREVEKATPGKFDAGGRACTVGAIALIPAPACRGCRG